MEYIKYEARKEQHYSTEKAACNLLLQRTGNLVRHESACRLLTMVSDDAIMFLERLLLSADLYFQYWWIVNASLIQELP